MSSDRVGSKRTSRARLFFRSWLGSALPYSPLALMAVTFAIPYLPFVRLLGFVPLPPSIVVALAVITVVYTLAAEITKSWFYRHIAV